jgi:hypothetical protein
MCTETAHKGGALIPIREKRMGLLAPLLLIGGFLVGFT